MGERQEDGVLEAKGVDCFKTERVVSNIIRSCIVSNFNNIIIFNDINALGVLYMLCHLISQELHEEKLKIRDVK